MSTITSLNNHLTTLETQLASPSRAGKPKPSTPIPNTKPHIELRPYHQWQGNNTICCDGRIVGGPQKRNFAITLILILLPSIFFIGFVSVNYISEYNYYYVLIIYTLLLIISVISFALTAFIDPGIIPRGILSLESGYKGPTQLRQTMCISGKLVEIKWCGTCHIFRPPRSFHCYICNNCVERFDHHCPWIGNCIGIRNYAYFSIFVNSLQLLCFWALFHCVYLLYLRTNHHKIQNKSSWKQFTYALKYEYMAFGTGIYIFIGMWFVIGLTWFHWFLVFVGKTTNEQLRNLHPSGSPFKRSCFGNVMDHCCQFPATSVHLHHVTPKTSYNEIYVNKEKVIFLDNEQVKKHHQHIHSMHIDNNSPFKACIINKSKTKTKTNAIVNGVDNNTLMTGNDNKYKNGYGFVIHPMQPTHIEMTHFNKKASTNGYQTLDATQNNLGNDGKIEEEEEIIIHSNHENDKEEKNQTIIIPDIDKNAGQKQEKDSEVKVDENAFEQFEENKYQHMDINYGDNGSSDSLAKSKSRKDENIDQENSYISYDDDDDEEDGNGSNPLQLQGQQFQYSMSATPDISAANGDRNSTTPAPAPQTTYAAQEINNEYKNETLEVTNVKNRNNPRLLSNVSRSVGSVASQSAGSDNW